MANVRNLTTKRIVIDGWPGVYLRYIAMEELILIRGISGSGKTTMAKRDFPDHEHFEADMFLRRMVNTVMTENI